MTDAEGHVHVLSFDYGQAMQDTIRALGHETYGAVYEVDLRMTAMAEQDPRSADLPRDPDNPLPFPKVKKPMGALRGLDPEKARLRIRFSVRVTAKQLLRGDGQFEFVEPPSYDLTWPERSRRL